MPAPKTTFLPAVFLIVSGMLAAGEPPADRVVSAAVGPSGMTLQPNVPYESAALTVTGEGRTVLRRRFDPGETIELSPVDADGNRLTDGSYRWELRLTTETAGPLDREARERTQTGTLTVRDGVFTAGGHKLGGVAAPTLSLEESNPTLLFVDSSTGDEDFSIEVDGDSLTLFGEGTNAILTAEAGVVGLFTTTPDPDVELHIVDGLPEIRLENSSLMETWDLRVVQGKFQIVDTDAAPFPPTVLEISGDAAGAYTMTFDGSIVHGSSRETKRELEPASGENLLATLRDLPLYTWSFKEGAPGVRHLGPMAEDFHAAFGLGRDDKHIASADAAGIALAAIQALARRLEEKDREIADLRARLEALEN